MFCNEQYFGSYIIPILRTFGSTYSIFFSFLLNDEDDKLENICFLVRDILLRLMASDDNELSKSNPILSREGGGKDIILLFYSLPYVLCALLK